jgi:cell division protein ZapA
MAHVTVTIAGRPYRMACADGEEKHLEGLGHQVDEKITELKRSFGEIGDQRITVMAAVTFADELTEANRKIAALEAEKRTLLEAQGTAQASQEGWILSVAEALNKAAARIENASQAMTAPRNGDDAGE